MLAELIVGVVLGSQLSKTKKTSHSNNHSCSQKKNGYTTKDYMNDLNKRIEQKLKTEKAYQSVRNSIW